MDIRPSRVRTIQNFHLIWLHENIHDMHKDDFRNKIIILRQVINAVNTFTDVKECIEFITGIKEEKVFLITSGAVDQTTVLLVHDMAQVRAIYIFCENETRHEQWVTQWPKVKGVFTDIAPICEALKQATQECDQNSISMSFVSPNSGQVTPNLDQLDQFFMYTQILKDILLTINFNEEYIMEFTTYCREQLDGNTVQLNNVDKFEEEYHLRKPVWWYTSQSFLYSMLNRALRTMEVDLIIKMGFFVRNLHEHITELHSEQYTGSQHSAAFTLFRGQGLSQTDFHQLVKTKGGLMSFNNFLSTSLDQAVSLAFAESNLNDPYSMGVLFRITIDPSVPSTPYAHIRDVSYSQKGEEILFSIHSIFRIGHIRQLDNNPRLWQVELTLTSDNDPQLHTLNKYIRNETFAYKGWLRLSMLLIKLGQFSNAQELCKILLEQTKDEIEKANIYYQLGWANDEQAQYAEAILYYKQSIEIREVILTPNHLHLANTYNSIGSVYNQMSEYSKALSYYKNALEIYRKTLPENHPNFATVYNNIGSAYYKMGEYSKGLSYHERALEIYQKNLPVHHPSLATPYNNIGSVYYNMGEYSKALSYCEKSLKIYQKSLPANHPSLATSYNNIGLVYDEMGEYSKALSSHEKVLEIYEKTLPANHPHLATSCNNIGFVYCKIGEYSKALSYHERALEISRKTGNSPECPLNNVLYQVSPTFCP